MVRLGWVVVVSGFWQLTNFTRIYRSYSVPWRVMADSRTVEPPSTVQKVYSGAADGQRELLALIGCYIYRIALYGSFPGRTICWFCRIFWKLLRQIRQIHLVQAFWRCRRWERAPGTARVLYIWHCTLWIFPRQNQFVGSAGSSRSF